MILHSPVKTNGNGAIAALCLAILQTPRELGHAPLEVSTTNQGVAITHWQSIMRLLLVSTVGSGAINAKVCSTH